jgi:hypothetical protein
VIRRSVILITDLPPDNKYSSYNTLKHRIITYILRYEQNWFVNIMLHNTSHIGDHSWFCLSCLGHLVFLLTKTFKSFGFPMVWFWAYLMKDIPDMCRAHLIWDLRFLLESVRNINFHVWAKQNWNRFDLTISLTNIIDGSILTTQ